MVLCDAARCSPDSFWAWIRALRAAESVYQVTGTALAEAQVRAAWEGVRLALRERRERVGKGSEG